ncbi:MAG: hypothetical protein AB9882_11950 [Ignavibacteriaceae bacterium]
MKEREGYYPEQIRDNNFRSILDRLNAMQYKVYCCIRDYAPVTTEDISRILRKYPHSISGRVTELRDLNLVEFAGERVINDSGRSASLWKIIPESPQLRLF